MRTSRREKGESREGEEIPAFACYCWCPTGGGAVASGLSLLFSAGHLSPQKSGSSNFSRWLFLQAGEHKLSLSSSDCPVKHFCTHTRYFTPCMHGLLLDVTAHTACTRSTELHAPLLKVHVGAWWRTCIVSPPIWLTLLALLWYLTAFLVSDTALST